MCASGLTLTLVLAQLLYWLFPKKFPRQYKFNLLKCSFTFICMRCVIKKMKALRIIFSSWEGKLKSTWDSNYAVKFRQIKTKAWHVMMSLFGWSPIERNPVKYIIVGVTFFDLLFQAKALACLWVALANQLLLLNLSESKERLFNHWRQKYTRETFNL